MVNKDFELKIKHKDLAHLNLPVEQIEKIMQENKHALTARGDNPLIDLLKVIRQPKNFYFTCKYIFNVELGPFQVLILEELWNTPFPMFMAARGASKSFLLAIYSLLRALICQGCRVALTGAVFRQSKVIFEYIETIWNNAPVLRDLLSGSVRRDATSKGTDKWIFYIGESQISAYPIGMGDKIRGQRANYLIVDEFATLNPEIFETVIAGFTAVAASPVENMKKVATIDLMKEIGIWDKDKENKARANYRGNQIIISGTAYYAFNHMCTYWKKYKQIIESKGDVEKIKEIHGGDVPDGFDWRDWKVIRIPIELIPKGFMDEKSVARSKAIQHKSIYSMEFGCVFPTDSDGFYRRSLVQSCTTTNPVIKKVGPVQFKASLHGDPRLSYVYGIDPASESDNFAIVVLEPHEDHRRIVYCWTMTDKIHKHLLSKGLVKEHDFYRYTSRKIRNLMKIFPCEHMAMDSQGGGKAVSEALHEPTNLEPGEQPIWIIPPEHPLSDGKERDVDGQEGLHILELVNFSSAEYTSDANHGMKKDFEMQELLFPFFDGLEVGLASEADMMSGRSFDTLEECVMEIEELKDELATIELTQTSVLGRERWDTPEVKISGSKKGRLRKDRYSALLMANAAARKVLRTLPAPQYNLVGGFANQIQKVDHTRMYNGPAWFTDAVNGFAYGGAVNKNMID